MVKQSNNLDEVFDRIVKPADMAGDRVVTLSLNISDIDTQTADGEKAAEISAIKTLADKGSEVYFFDMTLEKTVSDGGETSTQTLIVC